MGEGRAQQKSRRERWDGPKRCWATRALRLGGPLPGRPTPSPKAVGGLWPTRVGNVDAQQASSSKSAARQGVSLVPKERPRLAAKTHWPRSTGWPSSGGQVRSTGETHRPCPREPMRRRWRLRPAGKSPMRGLGMVMRWLPLRPVTHYGVPRPVHCLVLTTCDGMLAIVGLLKPGNELVQRPLV